MDVSGVLQVTLEGLITMRTVLDVIECQWRLLAQKCFWDISTAQLNQLSATQIQRIADHVNDNRPANFLPGASVFLVSRDIEYGMMRMAEAYSDNLGFEIKVSRDRTELEQWLLSVDVTTDKSST